MTLLGSQWLRRTDWRRGSKRRSGIARRSVFARQPICGDPAQVLADEPVCLNIVDAFAEAVTFRGTHPLTLRLPFDGLVAATSHQPIPKIAEHSWSLCDHEVTAAPRRRESPIQ